MGVYFFDKYSFLHYCVGCVLFYWNISFITGLIIHIIFEYVKNTKMGMKIINKYFIGNSHLQWPGGKNRTDKMINRVGDTVFFALGWITAYVFNEY